MPAAQELAAQYLERSPVPSCAAVRILADELDYEIDTDSAAAALQWLWDYQQLNRFNRANALSKLLDGGWDSARHNDFWLQQAKSMLHRGEVSNVEHALRRLRDPLDAEAARKRQSLLGSVLLLQRRFAEATEVLQALVDDFDPDIFDRYNLAMALLGHDKSVGQGQKLLDELSQLPARSAEDLALRDRINLALAWSWLSAQKGGTARPYFRRIRLEGPDANKALLGMGWAELVPNGKPQFASVFMGFYHEFAYESAVKGAERFRRALKPWQVLRQRALHDPAVQEALQAIAFVHEKLRDSGQAASAYRFAIHQYRTELARLDDLEGGLRVPGTDPRQTVYREARRGEFSAVLASQAFAHTESELEALQHCHLELQDVRDRADYFQRRLLEHLQQLENRMLQSHEMLLDDLRGQYLADIARRRRLLQAYLARASFALAVLQDRRGAY